MNHRWISVSLFLLMSVQLKAEPLPEVIEVFVLTDQVSAITGVDEFVRSGGDVYVHVVDAVDRWERERSAQLTGGDDADVAIARAHEIAKSFTDEEKQILVHGWMALRRADALGITRTPAIVFDQSTVVYGSGDLTAALVQLGVGH